MSSGTELCLDAASLQKELNYCPLLVSICYINICEFFRFFPPMDAFFFVLFCLAFYKHWSLFVILFTVPILNQIT